MDPARWICSLSQFDSLAVPKAGDEGWAIAKGRTSLAASFRSRLLVLQPVFFELGVQALSAHAEGLCRHRPVASGPGECLGNPLALDRFSRRPDQAFEGRIGRSFEQGTHRKCFFRFAAAGRNIADNETEVVRLTEPIADCGNLDFCCSAEFAVERCPHRAHRSMTLDEVHDDPKTRSWLREPPLEVLPDHGALNARLNQIKKRMVDLPSNAFAINDYEAVRHPLQEIVNGNRRAVASRGAAIGHLSAPRK